MSISNIKHLFKNKVKGNKRTKVFDIGEEFPVNKISYDFSKETIICFLSLSCASCMKLLPDLEKISESIKDDFLLITDGESDENEEIKKYYHFHFPIVAFNDEYGTIGVPFNPYFYKIDLERKVVGHFSADTVEEFEIELSKLS